MSTQKQQLFNLIEELPEELSDKVIDYVEYVTFAYVVNENNAPKELIIRSKEDLIKKLEEGEKSIANGDTYSVEEVFTEIDQLLAH